jgi:ribosomal protein L33
MNNTLENALRETWEIKDNFYEKNKNLSLKEILIKIESKKYSPNIKKHNIKDPIV